MKVQLNLVNDAVHFEATSPSTKVKVHIDGSPDIGGLELGARPIELVLMALASCSSLDLVTILRKQRQDRGQKTENRSQKRNLWKKSLRLI